MGKCVAGADRPYIEITICGECLHKDVCGDKDYIEENECCNYIFEEFNTATKLSEELEKCKENAKQLTAENKRLKAELKEYDDAVMNGTIAF